MSKKEDAQKMAELGAFGGKANLKKHGKGRMKKISNDYWSSPEGQKRRIAARSKH